MKIYLATGNLNKKKEMQEILPDFTVVIPKDEGIDFDPVENGSTFYENSLIKARTLWNIVHCPVLADDSGICVDALNGKPGIYSARYAGPDFMEGKPDGTKISQDLQNRYLIQQTNDALKGGNFTDSETYKSLKAQGFFPNGERSCHYVCAMVLYCGPDHLYVSQDTMEGTLIDDINEARGNGGFGYDPIIFLPQYGKTVAELSADEKNAISHRGKASKALVEVIRKIF